MSSEEQVADTIEMLYQRLNSYNKQDLFNYGYLLESNQILCKDIEEKDKEIKRLNHECDTYLKIATKRKNIINKSLEYVIYLGLKCKYRLNTGHLRKLKKILQGDYNE